MRQGVYRYDGIDYGDILGQTDAFVGNISSCVDDLDRSGAFTGEQIDGMRRAIPLIPESAAALRDRDADKNQAIVDLRHAIGNVTMVVMFNAEVAKEDGRLPQELVDRYMGVCDAADDLIVEGLQPLSERVKAATARKVVSMPPEQPDEPGGAAGAPAAGGAAYGGVPAGGDVRRGADGELYVYVEGYERTTSAGKTVHVKSHWRLNGNAR